MCIHRLYEFLNMYMRACEAAYVCACEAGYDSYMNMEL